MNSTTTKQAATDSTTPIRVIADNMMRRVLRIQDPNNPLEVAEGLGRAYPLESAELDEEIRGLPVTPPISLSLPMTAPSMTGRELTYAQDNIKCDLDFLVGSSQLKEVQVELQGWGETIRHWLADGAAAANQGLDSGARDRVFSARRILIDYARVARLVGAMTPGLSIAYRRLARSLDEAAGLLLVTLGESLAQIGFSGDRLLLQAPASELGARAETAISALRNLTSLASNGFSPTVWPWGFDAYRRLLNEIEAAGHGDVRVLLTENGLRAFSDELINQSSSVTGDGLRTLAATHVVALDRLDRVILVGERFAKDAPPVASFISALRLFQDAFTGGTSAKLIALGRPLLSASWLYSFGGLDRGSAGTLFDLVRIRSAAAQLHDSLFGAQLNKANAQAQFAVDNCLYGVDLAIDLYAVGMDSKDNGSPEMRAAAYGFFIWQLLTQKTDGISDLIRNAPNVVLPDDTLKPPSVSALEHTLLDAVVDLIADVYTPQPPLDLNKLLLGPPPDFAFDPPVRDALLQELEELDGSYQRLHALADALTPGNFVAEAITKPARDGLGRIRDKIAKPASMPPKVVGQTIPPPVESTLAGGVEIIGSFARPAGPAIDRVTVSDGSIIVFGTGLVNVRWVFLNANNEGFRERAFKEIDGKLEVPVRDLSRAHKQRWEIMVFTKTGDASASVDQSTTRAVRATS